MVLLVEREYQKLHSTIAAHAVSMNNTNYLISIDNLGYASYLLEQEYNPGHLVGTGPFVSGFSTSNSADISPNILGPRCYVQ